MGRGGQWPLTNGESPQTWRYDPWSKLSTVGGHSVTSIIRVSS